MKTNLLLAACLSVAIFMPHLAEAQGGRGSRGGHGGASYHYPGYQVPVLPPGYTRLRVGPSRYYYYGSVFYRPVGRPPASVIVPAPIGARISRLPAGYVGFFSGPSHHFYLNATWYLWDDRRTEYIVAKEPEGAQERG